LAVLVIIIVGGDGSVSSSKSLKSLLPLLHIKYFCYYRYDIVCVKPRRQDKESFEEDVIAIYGIKI
jgi:hypothetical protein